VKPGPMHIFLDIYFTAEGNLHSRDLLVYSGTQSLYSGQPNYKTAVKWFLKLLEKSSVQIDIISYGCVS
jgi:hypothetical protein